MVANTPATLMWNTSSNSSGSLRTANCSITWLTTQLASHPLQARVVQLLPTVALGMTCRAPWSGCEGDTIDPRMPQCNALCCFSRLPLASRGSGESSQLQVGGVEVIADDGDARIGDEEIDALRVRLLHLPRCFL